MKYVDPDGRITKEEEKRRNTLFNQILSYVTKWEKSLRTNITGSGPAEFIVLVGTISEDGIAFLKQISSEACTAGAIAIRNKYRNDKIGVSPLAVDLKNNYKDKSYYRYGENDYRTYGQIITDREMLFEMLQVGDILIYTNPENPDGSDLSEWTGHTATIIEKGSNYVITIEYHQFGENPTIQAISKEALQNFEDTELYGGARWN